MKNKARDGVLFNRNEQTAYDKGYYIGKQRKVCNEYMGNANSTGLRGRMKLIFAEGLEDGYSEIEHNGQGVCEKIGNWNVGTLATWQGEGVRIVALWAPGEYHHQNTLSMATISNMNQPFSGTINETVHISDLSEYTKQ